jgi:ribonuclease HII
MDKTNKKIRQTLSRNDENRLKSNYDHVIGIDEAGRGPLAGPVVAAACFIEENCLLPGIMDSKISSEEMRENVYDLLTTSPDVYWAVSIIDNKVIDNINILQSSLLAMKESCMDLIKKINSSKFKNKKFIALIDGNKIPLNMPVDSKYVIKGDSFVYSIAAAR